MLYLVLYCFILEHVKDAKVLVIFQSLLELFKKNSVGSTSFSCLEPYKKVVALIFFFSGFSSLLYQVVWQRVLTQEIGVDTLSVTFIVTIFMVGLGFGALWGG
jgi:hypothetical protein